MRVINSAEFISEADLNRLTPNDREAMYNGLDCCVTLELLETLLAELDDDSRATYQLSLDMRGPILEMSMRGIRVDQARRAAVLIEKQNEHERIAHNLTRLLREGMDLTLNYRSVADLKYLFYTVLGLKPIKKRNAQGMMVPTVNRDALERLQIHYYAGPICRHLLALRDLDKKISFLKTGIDSDGRMRATFNIAGTNTGRLSSSMSEFGTGTNLQNVDRSLRSIFIPDPGMKFVNVDLEQGDSRNMGAMMWDIFHDTHGPAFAGSYLDACESADLHTTVCRMTWKNLEWSNPLDQNHDRQVAEQLFYRKDSYRQVAKKLGHGTNYGGQPPTMAMHTKMPVKIIGAFQSSYFSSFPVIPAYHEWVRVQLKEYSCLRTLHNRRRYFFGRSTDPKTINEAIAYPSQSMTADAVNKAMLQIWRSERINSIQLLCQVHDSLLFQVPYELCDELVPYILEKTKVYLNLKGGREFFVPNEAKVGWNWGDWDKREPEANPNGLKVWKGGDDRKAPVARKLSIIRLIS